MSTYTLDPKRSECALEAGKLRWWIRDKRNGQPVESCETRAQARKRLAVWNDAERWQRLAHIPYPNYLEE